MVNINDIDDLEIGDRVVYTNGRTRYLGNVRSLPARWSPMLEVYVDEGYALVMDCSFIEKTTSQLLLERIAAETVR